MSDIGEARGLDVFVGAVVWLRNTGRPDEYDTITLQDGLARTCDARAGDFDGDGDEDVIVAEFGYLETGRILIKDAIADITLQQVLTRPGEFDVIATMNLNGDYLSDALAAQVGGIGIAPGGNINYLTGTGLFEATHGTAPKYANLDKVNPGSLILSGEMMLRFLGWTEAADLIIATMGKTIRSKTVTYDFARLMDGAKEVKCSEFGTALIANL